MKQTTNEVHINLVFSFLFFYYFFQFFLFSDWSVLWSSSYWWYYGVELLFWFFNRRHFQQKKILHLIFICCSQIKKLATDFFNSLDFYSDLLNERFTLKIQNFSLKIEYFLLYYALVLHKTFKWIHKLIQEIDCWSHFNKK